MEPREIEIMAGGLQVGLQLACLLLGVSIVCTIARINDEVSEYSAVVLTDTLVRQGKMGIVFMLVSTLFTVLQRGTSLALLMAFIFDSSTLMLLDTTIFPLAVTVAQFTGVLVLHDAVLDCYDLNIKEGA